MEVQIIKSLNLILGALLTIPLYPNFEDHLKTVTGKSPVYSMHHIDCIYMINLDQRPEKFKSCMKQLAPYGIYPLRFSAVNGWELPFDVIEDVGVRYGPWMEGGCMATYYTPDGEPLEEMVGRVGRTYFHNGSKGCIGILLSHLSILQDAYDAGYETIWVMEDDIEVIRNPHLLSELIAKLDLLVGKEGWDVLFTDRDTKGPDGNYVICLSFAWRPNFTPENPHRFAIREDVDAELRRVGARYGAYSMIIRRSGMIKLLNFFKQYDLFLPYDMDYYLPSEMRLYTVLEDVVSTQPRAISDNAKPSYR